MNQLASRLIDQLQARVVVDLGAGHEARAEGAVPALLEQAVVADEVLGVVGGVGHHDRHRVALEDVEAGPDRHPEAAFVVGAVDSGRAGCSAPIALDHRCGRSPRCRRRRRRPRSRSPRARARRRRLRPSPRPSPPRSGPASRPRASCRRRRPALEVLLVHLARGCPRPRSAASSPGSRPRTAPGRRSTSGGRRSAAPRPSPSSARGRRPARRRRSPPASSSCVKRPPPML